MSRQGFDDPSAFKPASFCGALARSGKRSASSESAQNWSAVARLRRRRYFRYGCLFLLPFLILALFVAIAPERLTAMDIWLSEDILEHRMPWLTVLMRVITEMAGIPFLILLVIIASWLFWTLSHHCTVTFWFMSTVVLGTVMMNPLLKLLFHRPRPNPAFRLVVETTNSFPSGHSLSSILVYGALAYGLYYLSRRRRGWNPRQFAIKAGAAAFSLLVAYSRVYLGAHYMSDVIAGLSLGTSLLYFSLSLSMNRLAFFQERAAEEARKKRTANQS